MILMCLHILAQKPLYVREDLFYKWTLLTDKLSTKYILSKSNTDSELEKKIQRDRNIAPKFNLKSNIKQIVCNVLYPDII